MNRLQFGNILIDLGNVVFTRREEKETVLRMRGGHDLYLGGEVGLVIWNRISGHLVDQIPNSEFSA